VPPLTSYIAGNIAVAVHWVSGTVPDYTIEVTCDPAPMFCAPTLGCGATQQGGLPSATGQAPNVVFSRNVDTHFFLLWPVPQGVGNITFTLGSPLDADADYDLFVGGPNTPPCAGTSTAYQYSSQRPAPQQDIINLTTFDLQQFAPCQPIPIAVYYYRDSAPAGGYALTISCN
jgi:hypothetical protein